MSLKIEPLSEESKPSEKQNPGTSNENKTASSDNKYKFLQKSGFSSKLKKSCSKRTCNTKEFQCRSILPEQRSLINNQFWIEMSANERLNYIVRNTTFLNLESEPCFLTSLTITGQNYSVCKKMFLSTLSLIEKNVKQILIENFENNKNTEKPSLKKIKSVKKSNNEFGQAMPTVAKKIVPKVAANRKGISENVLKIEYVEVNADSGDCELDENNTEDLEIDEINLKKPKRKQAQPKASTTKNIKFEKKGKNRRWAKTEYDSDNECPESSDESWKEDMHSDSPISGDSDSDENEVEIPPIKIEKRSQRPSRKDPPQQINKLKIMHSDSPISDESDFDENELKIPPIKIEKRSQRPSKKDPPLPIKKLKIEPQSDVENMNSSSDDDNFSIVEDTDESDTEENNKIQTQLVHEKVDQYYSDGKTIPKKMGPSCSSKLCAKLVKRNCKNIKEIERQILFDEFWNKMSLSDRKFYVKQNVEVLEEKGRPKSITPLFYYLTIGENKLQVCQRMFHGTLALQNSCVYNWVYDRNPNNMQDDNDIKNILDPLDTPKTLKARRRFENYTEKLQLLEDFLDSLDKMPPKSFPQQKIHKYYLTEEIEGLRNLQRLYKEIMKSEGVMNPLPVKILKKVFCAKHYTFYTGYKKRHAKFKTIDDTEITPEIEEAMKRDQQERQRDKILTKKPGSNIVVLDIDTCDGKVSPNWNGDGEESEPNSRLCCFNLTISNVISLHTYNYWFCEIDALDTTPSSFITCIMDYFANFCTSAKQIILYCRIGDDRFKNVDMTNALLDYAILNKVIITQKFYIPRKHLYKDETECQSVYRSLYRKLRRFEINLPSDYVTATIDCKREPMEAKWFNFNQFRDYSVKSKKHRYTNLWDDTEEIDKIKSIISKYDGTVSIKMDFDDEWVLLPSSLKRKPSASPQTEWPQLSYDRRKISAVKYQLLQSLKVKLPRDCHFFYDYLTIEI